MEQSMKSGVNDITDIKATIQTGEHKVTGHFSTVMNAYYALRSWYEVAYEHHGKPMPINVIFTASGNKMGGVYNESFDHFSYGSFIRWLAEIISNNGELATVRLNRPAQVHVSWDYLYRYLAIRRKKRKKHDAGSRTLNHSFSRNRLQSRAALIRLLEGYDWTFKFQDIEGGEWHYYYNDDIGAIRHELMRIALDTHTIGGNPDYLTQSDALYGLQVFYKEHPEFLDRVSTYHIERLVRFMKPGIDFWVAKEAKTLVIMLGQEKTQPFIDAIIQETESWLEETRNIFSSDELAETALEGTNDNGATPED